MLLSTALFLGSLPTLTTARPHPRDIRGSLRPRASTMENNYQPLVDFDRDGCYYTSAVDSDGNTNPGIWNVIARQPWDDCRTPDRLENNNVYSRKRCNRGICAIMYEYYFEKDQTIWGSYLNGHKDDWENVVVFTRGGSIVRVAPSCHGHYEHAADAPNLPLDGPRAKVVYHKDGGGTHCFRIAKEEDEEIENYTGAWFKGQLVGWNDWPRRELRDKMMATWAGTVGPKLGDEKFESNVREAMGSDPVGSGLGPFDPSWDEPERVAVHFPS